MNMKKLISMVLALVMLLAMSATAMADANAKHTITITNAKETGKHIYEAYQVFKGDISDGKLVNIVWGTGVNSGALLTALKSETRFGDAFNGAATAEDVAKVISAENFTADKVDVFAQIVSENLTSTVAGTSTEEKSPYTINVTGDGYYLVKDKDNSAAAEIDAYTKIILKVVGDIEVAAKADAPTLEKKIVEGNDLVDANTAEIGEYVNYKLTSKVPAMDGYNKYYFVIHDTMSQGLTFDPTSVKVSIGSTELASAAFDVITTGLNDGCTFEIVLKNFIQYKEQAGSVITVTYSALVNEKAVIGENGNPNTTHLEYSNNPNVDYDGDGDKPDEDEPTGETPDDTVITYVTEIKLTKVDKDNHDKKLTGAKFKIEGVSSKIVIINKEMYVEKVDGEYYRLKNGTYTMQAPTDDTKAAYDSIDTKYDKVTVVTKETIQTPVEAEGWVDANGVITFTGLAEGTYTITELIAPEGYNLLKAPITVVITSNVAEITEPTVNTKVTWTAEDAVGKDWTVTNGIVNITVENTKGATLPSTGAQGTKMLYIAGGILVAAAVILLITKRRMDSAE